MRLLSPKLLASTLAGSLQGAAKPVHELNHTVAARGIANMSAFAVVEARTDR
ncbi:hypothetical protein [Halomonas cerina]|uniref:Phosphotransacetylase n=1 Tax=Halomonas cerina TaxID=447424 RepID=A0A839VD95_9GAMM|nr:hypothetical protein [Halomonas cerina]MBB3192015.1 phosphotransacetylase [Halomonas cerina]